MGQLLTSQRPMRSVRFVLLPEITISMGMQSWVLSTVVFAGSHFTTSTAQGASSTSRSVVLPIILW
jgi:hypothetical protein